MPVLLAIKCARKNISSSFVALNPDVVESAYLQASIIWPSYKKKTPDAFKITVGNIEKNLLERTVVNKIQQEQ